MHHTARCLLLSLGFLSRLAPAFTATNKEMGRAFALFPLSGALLAAVSCLPLFLPFFSRSPLSLALVTVAFNIWLTRGLHVDGLADTLDALGSMKYGDDFHAVRKDSRTGAFGALGIALYLVGSVCLLTENIRLAMPLTYFSAIATSRCIPILVVALASPHSSSTLGKLFTAQWPAILLALLCALLALCLLPFFALFLALLFSGGLLLFIRRLSTLHGGYTGDFLGFAILGTELIVLAAPLV